MTPSTPTSDSTDQLDVFDSDSVFHRCLLDVQNGNCVTTLKFSISPSEIKDISRIRTNPHNNSQFILFDRNKFRIFEIQSKSAVCIASCICELSFWRTVTFQNENLILAIGESGLTIMYFLGVDSQLKYSVVDTLPPFANMLACDGDICIYTEMTGNNDAAVQER